MSEPIVEPSGTPSGAVSATQLSTSSRFWTLLGWVWASLPLVFALPAPVTFGWAAYRLRSRRIAVEAAGYLFVCVVWVSLANQKSGTTSNIGVMLALAATAVACGRGLFLRRRLFSPSRPVAAPAVAAPAAAAPVASAGPTTWVPSFPAQKIERDPNSPATWVAPVACTGADRHQLSIPVKHTAWAGLAGAALVGFDVHFHVYGRGMGTGIGLLLLPAFAALFNRWVDGPVLYYRNWGRLHQLRLDTVSSVTTAGGRGAATSIALAAPGQDRPVRVSLLARGYVMSPAARDHLRGWLSSPAVQWTPQARQLFDAHTLPATEQTRRRHRGLAVALGVVLPLALVATGAVVAFERNSARHIPGAPGYRRFGGPHGKLLAVGRPWGHPCQPVRFTVEEHTPDAVYQQVAEVISEARRDGINVTLETRNFYWTPASVYYPPGLTPATVPRVGIFAHWENPPHLANGRPEHIGLGWDAVVDPDGSHEDLTDAKGDLWMKTLDGDSFAIRRSIRQLIAMTQGIIATSRHDSGIANGRVDHFSASDIAAMQHMSGCNGNARATVSTTP